MSMNSLQKLEGELDQWKERCDQAKKQRAEKKIEKFNADEELEHAEKQSDLMEEEAKKTQKFLKEKQAYFEEELYKLKKRNHKLRDVVDGLQWRLNECTEASQKVQEILQVKGQLPPTDINFLREDVTPGKNPTNISNTCRILKSSYVLEGGQALLTFEDEKVARSIISRGSHTVDLEDVTVNVRASEPQLEKYVTFEVKMNISDRKLKVLNLPSDFSDETLKDKVELAFYKSAIGGGEIETVEYDRSNNSAYVTYLQSGVAQRVLKVLNSGHHCIVADGVSHDIQVKPCVDVQLDKLQMFSGISKRSVLLTGINNINGEEGETRDLIEVHFLKPSKGGGDVETTIFSQKDKKMLIFQEDQNGA